MLTQFKRAIRLSWTNFLRQGALSFATCFILVMAIALVTSLFILKDASQFMISNLQERVDISVYFKNESQEEDILKVKDEVAKIPEVKSIEYVSKEEALEAFTQKHQDDSILMESLTELGENPLLASLNIKAWQPDQYQKVSDYLNGLESENLIEKIDYSQRKSIIERIFVLTSGFKTAGLIAGIILSLVAVLITFNTIRLAILNQKEEISIQRLVGASNWFIRGPFLIQGAIAGFFASLISLLIFGISCWLLSPKIEILFSDLNIFGIFVNNFWMLFLIQLATGIILGAISSLIAVRKYLKV
ncbi:MAG: permease-like cell division protein FtsX [Candidatus Pacebacteria bacterium]|nr:permease-like cell division protein FtsX [Candidatus Paceibacterota bacterium]